MGGDTRRRESKSLNEYGSEAKAYIEFATRSHPFSSVWQARRAFYTARRAFMQIEPTLSGCDWCDDCGGGALLLGSLRNEYEQARRFLESKGESVGSVCTRCTYADATNGSVCDKCAQAE